MPPDGLVPMTTPKQQVKENLQAIKEAAPGDAEFGKGRARGLARQLRADTFNGASLDKLRDRFGQEDAPGPMPPETQPRPDGLGQTIDVVA